MRHLFVTNDFPPKQGGIESYLTTLCSGFDPKDVVVVAPSREGFEQVDPALPYAVVRLPGSYIRPSSRVRDHIVQIARAEDVSAVHFLQAFPLGRLAPQVRSQLGVPVTVVAHGTGDLLVPARTPLVKRGVRKVLTEVDLVLAVSRYTKAAVETFTKNEASVGLLPPGVDIERFSLGVSGARIRHRLKLRDRFVVLFVSRLVKRKGADVLLQAMASVRDAVAVVVGSGPEDQSVRRMAEELEISGRVVFAGQAPDDMLPQFYAAADVFCMPCKARLKGLDTEGFGVVYLEAAASGIPSIAGRCGGSVEAVTDGETGIVLGESTPDALAHALGRLRDDETRRIEMGAAARARVEREFAPAVLARSLEHQVEELLAGRRSA